jgi:hypothetical protein
VVAQVCAIAYAQVLLGEWQRIVHRHFHLDILQLDRFQRSAAGDLDQRGKVTVGFSPVEVDVGLDRGATEMPVEDRPRRLQAHALVGTVEQLAEALDRSRR